MPSRAKYSLGKTNKGNNRVLRSIQQAMEGRTMTLQVQRVKIQNHLRER